MKLDLSVKGGIIRTISRAIYPTNLTKIREAVANSRDNNAECFIMSYDKSLKKLSFIDNGEGIDEVKIKKIFQSLGYGLQRDTSDAVSYFGLGIISILQLAQSKAVFYSKSKGKEPIWVEVNTQQLFSEDNENKNLQDLNQFVEKIENITPELVSDYSKKDRILEKFKGIKDKYRFDTFTEIILLDVDPNFFSDISENEKFTRQLTKTLPLPINSNDDFFGKFKDTRLKEEIISFFNDTEFCRTIDFYKQDENYMPELPEENDEGGLEKLFKYFPPFGMVNEITNENFFIRKDRDFKFYVLVRVDNLFTDEEGSQGKKVNGFAIRSQNFLIKENDFFDYEFLDKRIISSPLRSWLFGEIFHKSLKEELNVSKSDFLADKDKFQDFIKTFLGDIDVINRLREAYNKRKEIRDKFKNPIEKIIDGDGFRDIQTKVKKIFNGDDEKIKAFYKKALERLQEKTKKDWYNNDKYLLENILQKQDIKLDFKDYTLLISDSIDNFELNAPISEGDKTIVKLPSDIFKVKEVPFLGEQFNLKFVYLGVSKGKKEDAINYNITNTKKEIFVNMFNENIKNFTIDVLEVIILVDLAYINSGNKEEMREYLLNYLQEDYRSAQNMEIISRLSKYFARGVDI